MKQLTFLIITFLLYSSAVYAQELAPAKMGYSQKELFINPAYTGAQGAFSGTIDVEMQLNSYDKSPSTQRLQAHSPFFNDKVGLGLAFSHESYGVSHTYGFLTNYAYRIKTNKGVLSLGLNAGFMSFQEKLSEIETPNYDPVFSENTKAMWGFSCGVGAYYADSAYYIGLSAPYLIDNSLKNGENKLASKLDFDKMPFYLTAGYVFKLNPYLRLKPAALLSYSGERDFGYHVSLTGYYQNKVWIGALARYKDEAGAFIGVNILDYVNLNYCCTFNYGSTLNLAGQNVTHQIALNVVIDMKNNKPKFNYF